MADEFSDSGCANLQGFERKRWLFRKYFADDNDT
jgi:hypothetical protein